MAHCAILILWFPNANVFAQIQRESRSQLRREGRYRARADWPPLAHLADPVDGSLWPDSAVKSPIGDGSYHPIADAIGWVHLLAKRSNPA